MNAILYIILSIYLFQIVDLMQINYTKTTLKKIELIFQEMSFDIRYVQGHFQSGYCVVAAKKIILISKFFNVQARIESLLEIMSQIEVDDQKLSDQSTKFIGQLTKFSEAA